MTDPRDAEAARELLEEIYQETRGAWLSERWTPLRKEVAAALSAAHDRGVEEGMQVLAEENRLAGESYEKLELEVASLRETIKEQSDSLSIMQDQIG